MPRVNDPYIGEALRKRLALKGPSDFTTVAPEIVPVIVADDIREQVSLSRAAMCGTDIAAVSGQYGYVQFYNLSGSGMVVELDSIMSSTNTNAIHQLRLYTGVVLGGTALTTFFRDTRARGSPALEVRAGTVVALGGTLIAATRVPAATPVLFNPDFILLPGEAIVVCVASVNLPYTVSAFWRERERRAEE